MDLKNRDVLVVGAGKSGISSVALLWAVGARPMLYDENAALDMAALREKLAQKPGASSAAERVEIYAGALPEEAAQRAQLLVMSPGVPVDTPFVRGFRSRGIPVWGEIELAYRHSKGRLIAITGTNGKTTTTSLVGKIMADHYAAQGLPGKVYVAGNIGDPYTDVALETTADDVTVLEVSSFQLETIDAFHPQISAILNITPDHLNRHHTMEAYAACKLDVTRNQTAEDVCVINRGDARLMDALAAGRFPCGVVTFGFSAHGAQQEEDTICTDESGLYCLTAAKAADARYERLMDIHEMKLLGRHNVENVMAAIGMACAAGVQRDGYLKSIREFTAVEHRIEYTASVDGVDYYNDSKGTNPDAAIKAVEAMRKPTVLIGGGYDKDSAYDEWIESFGDKVTWLILLGQTRDKIAACARAHGFTNVVLVASMEEAVAKARELARPGDAVLLSPACASWGMFTNYEERGRIFKALVRDMGA